MIAPTVSPNPRLCGLAELYPANAGYGQHDGQHNGLAEALRQ
jgi:hypothetical protein